MDTFRHSVRTTDIAGPDTRSKAKARVVGDGDRLILVFELDHGKNRPKDFFLGNAWSASLRKIVTTAFSLEPNRSSRSKYDFVSSTGATNPERILEDSFAQHVCFSVQARNTNAGSTSKGTAILLKDLTASLILLTASVSSFRGTPSVVVKSTSAAFRVMKSPLKSLTILAHLCSSQRSYQHTWKVDQKISCPTSRP
jgi:hypothetical protein